MPSWYRMVIQELLVAKASARRDGIIDHDSAGSVEKKQEGYI